jgi:hypothetical protein
MPANDSTWDLDPPSPALWHRLGGLFGILAPVLIFTGAAIGDQNDSAADLNPDQSSAVLAERLVTHRDEILQGATVQALGVLALVGFVAWIAAWLRPRTDLDRWIAHAVLGGGFLAAGVMLVYIGITIASVQIDNYGADTTIARTFAALMWEWARVQAVPFAMLVLATSVALIRRSGGLAIFGGVGLLAVVLALVPATAWIGLMGIIIWMMALAVVMMVSPAPREPADGRTAIPAPHGV